MNLKLSAEQREALKEWPGPILVEDDQTKRIYYLVEARTFERMKVDSDLASLQRGIADAEAGRMTPLEDAIAEIKSRHAQ